MVVDFVLGAIAFAMFVLLVAWLRALSGASDPARGSWALFGFAGLVLLFGLAQQNPVLLGAAAGGVAATSAFVWWSARRNRQRDQVARSVADELGLSYEQDSASAEIRDLASALTIAGDRNQVQRALSGRWRGYDVKLFDYGYEVDTPRGGAVERNFTCALVSSPIDSEPITITAESFLTKVAAKVGYRDLQLGDPDFDRVFNVRSKDPTAAPKVLGPAVRAWLSEHGRGLNFLIGRGAVLCMASQGTVSRAELLESATRLRDLISPAAVTASRSETTIDRSAFRVSAAQVDADPNSSGPGRRIALGLAMVLLVPIAFVFGGYVLLYIACATGNGCV